MSLTISISLSVIQKNRLLCEMGNELSDLYSDPNGSPLLSLKELEPQYYMQIAEYVKDRVRMNSIPRMAVILFMDKILSKDISTVKAEVISNIIKYTFPMDSKETAVMLYFAYCYIVKVAPPRANDVKALLWEAKKCKAEGAQQAIAILEEKFFPQTHEAILTNQQSRTEERKQRKQEHRFLDNYQSRVFRTNVSGIEINLEAVYEMIALLLFNKSIKHKYMWYPVILHLRQLGICNDNTAAWIEEINANPWFPNIEQNIKPSTDSISRYAALVKNCDSEDESLLMLRNDSTIDRTKVTPDGVKSIYALKAELDKDYPLAKFMK